MHTCITACPICLWAHATFETPPSTRKHCCLSAVINVKSLQNRGNTSEKLWRERLQKPQLRWMRTLLNFIGFPICPQIIPDALSRKNYETFLSWGNCFYSNLIPLFRLLGRHQSVCMCACACACVCVLGVLTQVNKVPLLPDLTQGDSTSCHTFLLS